MAANSREDQAMNTLPNSRRLSPAILACLLFAAAPARGDKQRAAGEKGANPPVLKIGTRKQLFVDDYIVAETENVTLDAGQATKHGVVLKPTLPSTSSVCCPSLGAITRTMSSTPSKSTNPCMI